MVISALLQRLCHRTAQLAAEKVPSESLRVHRMRVQVDVSPQLPFLPAAFPVVASERNGSCECAKRKQQTLQQQHN